MARFQSCLVLFGLSLFVASCTSGTVTPAPSAPPSPTLPVASASPTRLSRPTPAATPSPTATPEPEDTGWRVLAPGVEERRLLANTGAGRERLQIVRLNPNQIHVRVIYQPAHPRKVSEWATILSNALVVVNAGYFSEDMQATGLIISDGIPSGRTYDDFAGMLAVGTDGQVNLRWLRLWPYRPDERLMQAVQSFPVLVKPGNVMGFPPDADQGQRSRRTVVAQDTVGRVILLASRGPHFSLHELAIWLTESDLELDIAMNLDGGTSTGLWISGLDSQIDSLVPVPAVIAIEPAGG